MREKLPCTKAPIAHRTALLLEQMCSMSLKNHQAILERVKYGGTTANPASVTENVLAELFGVEKLVVLRSIANKAAMGADADMQFIGDPDAFLASYATTSPRY